MDPRQITPEITVTPQIDPEDVAQAAEMGFRTLIINRPDGENDPAHSSAAICSSSVIGAPLPHFAIDS